MAINGNKWVVARCAPKATLDLAKKARDCGAEVFAPSRQIRVRIPRRRIYVTKDYPILGSFLFINSSHWQIASREIGRDVRLMVIRGSHVFVERKEIHAMQMSILGSIPDADATINGKADIPEFNSGDKVRINLGPFSNYIGTIKSKIGDEYELDLGTFFGRVCISPFLLSRIEE